MTAFLCLTYDDALPVPREVVAPELAKRGLFSTFIFQQRGTICMNTLRIGARLQEWGTNSATIPVFIPAALEQTGIGNHLIV